MSKRFEELDWRETPLGEISLRRRREEHVLGQPPGRLDNTRGVPIRGRSGHGGSLAEIPAGSWHKRHTKADGASPYLLLPSTRRWGTA